MENGNILKTDIEKPIGFNGGVQPDDLGQSTLNPNPNITSISSSTAERRLGLIVLLVVFLITLSVMTFGIFGTTILTIFIIQPGTDVLIFNLIELIFCVVFIIPAIMAIIYIFQRKKKATRIVYIAIGIYPLVSTTNTVVVSLNLGSLFSPADNYVILETFLSNGLLFSVVKNLLIFMVVAVSMVIFMKRSKRVKEVLVR